MASTTSTSAFTSSGSSGFTGSTPYAADLQNAISRAVGFASLPLQILQNQQNDLNNRQSALSSLSNQFQSLQTAVDGISRTVGSGSLAAQISTPAVLSTTIAAGATAGSYSLNVTNIGSQTNMMSGSGLTTVTNPDSGNLDSSSSYSLTVDGTAFSIANPTGTLNGLAQAINSSTANVQASVVNVGSSGAPDYRLSIQGLKYAPTTIQLSDSNNPSILNTLSTGSNVTYNVNGQTTASTSDTRSVTLAPGLTVNLKTAGSTSITVSQSSGAVTTALSSFAAAYNSAVDELAKSRGQNGGALTGDSLISTLSATLHSLIDAGSSSGQVSSMADLGLTFDQNGHLSLNSSTLGAASSSTLNDVTSFLGSKTTGGFLKAASDMLNGLNDPTKGLFAQTSATAASQLSNLGTKISADQDRISLLQQSLTAQMAKADATIASLQSQSDYFTSLFAQTRANQLSSANG